MGVDGPLLGTRVRRRIALAQLLAGLVGALDVFCLLWFVLPAPDYATSRTVLFVVNAGALLIFLAAVAALSSWKALRWYRRATAWLREDRPPNADERAGVLCHPRRLAGLDGVGWGLGALVFFALNVPFSAPLAFHISSTMLLGAITTIALGYLLTEWLMRPLTARTLSFGPTTPIRPGVKGRLVLTWIAATASRCSGSCCSPCTRSSTRTGRRCPSWDGASSR